MLFTRSATVKRVAICSLAMVAGLIGGEISLPSGKRVIIGVQPTCAKDTGCSACDDQPAPAGTVRLRWIWNVPTNACRDYDNDGILHCVPHTIHVYGAYDSSDKLIGNRAFCTQSGSPSQTTCTLTPTGPGGV
jgi:hypothetical protein